MNKRISIKGDGICFGIEFFIQAALFEKTELADWNIVYLYPGPRDNYSDGEIDSYYFAYRICIIGYENFGRENEKRIIKKISLIPIFRINGSSYSYKYIFEKALSSIKEEKDIDFASENCNDEMLIPNILKEKYI